MTAPDRHGGLGPLDHVAPTRRRFLAALAAAGIGASVALGHVVTEGGRVVREPWVADDVDPVTDLPEDVTRTWLGPDLWANRLQDWRLSDGGVECLRGEAGHELRTASLLTRSLGADDGAAHLRVSASVAGDAGAGGGDGRNGGFCGFLIGVGDDELDHRAAALAQRGSGVGGGTLCTFEADGRARFREHTDDANPLAFEPQRAESTVPSGGARRIDPDATYRLALDVLPQRNRRYTIQLTVRRAGSSEVVAGATRRGVPAETVRGGVALVSSPPTGEPGLRFRFEGLRAGGRKLRSHPGRRFGPVAATLYSLDRGREGSNDPTVLKLSAQFLPVGDRERRTARLQYRPVGEEGGDGEEGEREREGAGAGGADDAGSIPSGAGRWRDGPTAPLEPGYVARFRVEDWDAGRDWEYRVRYEGDRGTPWTYRGLVRADPDAASDGSSGFGVGLLGCLRASARQLESAPAASSTRPPFGTLGRYTDENLYFPFDALVDNLRRRDPDLLVFTGDQLYETSPTRAVAGDPTLDYLYKWLLWCWSFGELTRRTPTVVLVDDHDVYQPNVWGAGGVVTDDGYNLGGYTERPEFVNTVQRTQCGHNPDAHDPRPVENGIEVYYGAFRYGGVEFAVLEDRKFKSPPPRGRVGDAGPPTGELLGERQESFLADWADRVDAGTPRICLTQTTLAAVQTTPDGVAMTDFDANGYPSPGRDRAVELLRDAGALVLSGDQHLASLIRHGLDGPADGVVQFNGPAGAATFQRWFEPRRALPNARAEPNTGDFTDAFGNAVRVLAVANPRIAFDRLRRLRGGWSQVVGDRGLKREGYGFVAVDPDAGEYVVECWPYDVDPSDGEQYAGWPYRLGFDEATGPPE